MTRKTSNTMQIHGFLNNDLNFLNKYYKVVLEGTGIAAHIVTVIRGLLIEQMSLFKFYPKRDELRLILIVEMLSYSRQNPAHTGGVK